MYLWHEHRYNVAIPQEAKALARHQRTKRLHQHKGVG
jgi:hypothetical protein